jgi:putative endonuclease
MSKAGYIYIMSNYKRTTFYIGVTNNLERRVQEHKEGLVSGFTKRYKLKYLMYYEDFPSITDAIMREKQLKNWHREWKINLIKSVNPEMKDLNDEILTTTKKERGVMLNLFQHRCFGPRLALNRSRNKFGMTPALVY